MIYDLYLYLCLFFYNYKSTIIIKICYRNKQIKEKNNAEIISVIEIGQ